MKLNKTFWLILVFLPAVACSARVDEARQIRDSARNTHAYFVAEATRQAGNESEKWREANEAIARHNQIADLEDRAFINDAAVVGAGVLFAIIAFAAMSGAMSYVIIQIRQRESRDYGRVVAQQQPADAPTKPPGEEGWTWVK
jgi:hypothetical protein